MLIKSYNTFLNEMIDIQKSYVGDWEKINKYEFIDFAKKDCKEIVKTRQALYRGVTTIPNSLKDEKIYIWARGSKTKLRIAANLDDTSFHNNNIYNLLFSNLPSWADYPKRNQSFICSDSVSSAGVYGNVYHVIPFDDAKVGICPKWDVWASFTAYNIPTLRFWVTTFQEEIENYLEVKIPGNIQDYNTLKKIILEFTKKVMDYGDLETFTNPQYHEAFPGLVKFIDNFYDDPNYTFLDYLNTILDPKVNNFKLTTGAKLFHDHWPNTQTPREVWTDGPVLMMNHNAYLEYVNIIYN